jgi:hypothetical protein
VAIAENNQNMRHQYQSKTQIRGREIIQAAFDHITENGPTTSAKLVELTGCSPQTVGKPKAPHFNDYLRDRRIPFRFAVDGGRGGKPIVWSLIPRKTACKA